MAIIGLLVAVGLLLLGAAVWLIRATRPEPEFLNPLVVMGKKWWRDADPVWQRRSLDQHRAPDAEPLKPMADPPKIDVDFDTGPQAPGFDDITSEDTAEDAADGSFEDSLIDFSTTDIDPEVLAEAERALDAELRGDAPPKS